MFIIIISYIYTHTHIHVCVCCLIDSTSNRSNTNVARTWLNLELNQAQAGLNLVNAELEPSFDRAIRERLTNSSVHLQPQIIIKNWIFLMLIFKRFVNIIQSRSKSLEDKVHYEMQKTSILQQHHVIIVIANQAKIQIFACATFYRITKMRK